MSNTTSCRIQFTGQKGIDLIKSFEGLVLKPYLCPAGVPTIGYGSTMYENGERVKLSDPAITEARAEGLLRATLAQFERGVDAVTRDDISQNQFDALVSFAFNLGNNALRGSTLLKLVNANPADRKIAAEFAKWVNAGGEKLPGLVRRRKAESDLYFG